MTFSFKRKHLVMAGALCAALTPNMSHASFEDYQEPFTYKQVLDAHENGSLLAGREGVQYQVTASTNLGYGFDENARIYKNSLTPVYGEEGTFSIEEIEPGNTCQNHMGGLHLLGCGPDYDLCCGGGVVFSATLNLVPVEEVKAEEVSVLSIVPAVQIVEDEEKSSIVAISQPSPGQVFDMLMENVDFSFHVGNALEGLLTGANDNDVLAGVIRSIEKQMVLNSKKK